ncbi:MAG: dynamin family protein [Pseudonocardia sp.]
MSTAVRTAVDMGAAVRAVLRRAIEAYADEPRSAQWLRRHLERMDEPLRVAIAGKVKAGKSTLLNALVGEEIAPTDAGECTRVVTWYRHGVSPRITLRSVDGARRLLPIRRVDGRLDLDLGGTPAGEVDRLVVQWPSRGLETATLIDTPGIASLSKEVSARTTAFLTPDDEPAAADAVVYLMRHLHGSDVNFLESFHDQVVGRATMVNTIAVLSRADEVGAGRIDALLSARKVAQRYRADPKLRSLCQTVVPVAGLIAQTGRTLRQAEFAALSELARIPKPDFERMLLSVDRFCRPEAVIEASPEQREKLLDRLGLFGVRLSAALIRGGATEPTALANGLVRQSGLDELRRVLAVQFTERRDLLKSRSALLAIGRVLSEQPRSGTEQIAGEVERILAGAHEFRELRLLAAFRATGLTLPPDAVAEAERLLGGMGAGPVERLGLAAEPTDQEQRAAAIDALRRWRARAESPMTDRVTRDACQVVTRTCEGLLARLPRD